MVCSFRKRETICEEAGAAVTNTLGVVVDRRMTVNFDSKETCTSLLGREAVFARQSIVRLSFNSSSFISHSFCYY